jgi:oxygen-independent coproporphyrinogen-3 oxidase
MAGIYIHIPFCRQACHYCNFHFSVSLRYKNELTDALLKEIEIVAQSIKSNKEKIETIYFGGGTPSLYSGKEIERILQSIHSGFTVAADAEITLEANPDDITEDQIAAWKKADINRLSIGIQSFFEEDLKWMNRAHTAEQAMNNLQLALSHFNNVTIDLIYGTPGLTHEKWEANVRKAIELNIPHLSCYALTVEPKTPLQKMISQHKAEDVDPSKQSEQFLLLIQWLEEAGYEHYEISSFAKAGFRSRHNSSYWNGVNYYGFGPSAHSFNGTTRWWNVANNNIYIQSINQGILPLEKEELTLVQKINEYIMTSLRTLEGLDLKKLEEMTDSKEQNDTITNQILRKGQKYIERGLLTIKKDRLILTKEGKLFADGIAADLFIDQ